jgi:hypothetical protein
MSTLQVRRELVPPAGEEGTVMLTFDGATTVAQVVNVTLRMMRRGYPILRLLAVRLLEYHLTGDGQAQLIISICDEYGLERSRVVCMTKDRAEVNARTMRWLIRGCEFPRTAVASLC